MNLLPLVLLTLLFTPIVGLQAQSTTTNSDTITTPASTETTLDSSTEQTLDLLEVQDQPKYPGGMEKLYRFIAKNYNWPPEDIKEGNGGRVFIQFVINKKGRVTDVKVIRGVNDRLDAEAIRVVESMPRWTPGYNDGKPVRVRYAMPILLKIN